MKAWFISDIHIKSVNERNSIILLRFLHSLARGEREATHLFLVGDIFDFWVGPSENYEQKFRAFVEVIEVLRRKKIQVIYFEGNHDVHVKKFWEKRDVAVFVEEQFYHLGPFKVRVEHGDLINPEDTTYLKYREFIRKPYMQKLADIITGKKLDAIGDVASRMSRKKSSVVRIKQEDKLRTMIHTYAEKVYLKEPYDYLITGHMHVKDEYRLREHKATSINLGSWFEEPQALLLEDKGHSWVSI